MAPFKEAFFGLLVLDDFGDGAHGALFNAVATRDTSILVDNFHNAADDL